MKPHARRSCVNAGRAADGGGGGGDGDRTDCRRARPTSAPFAGRAGGVELGGGLPRSARAKRAEDAAHARKISSEIPQHARYISPERYDRLAGADLTGANLTDATLSFVNPVRRALRRAACERARFDDANLTRANGRRSRCTNATFYYAFLGGARFRDATLDGADFEGAWLLRADFSRARLRGAALARTVLTHARLRRADLSRANLRSALLVGADLAGANLTDADLSGADLTCADVSRAAFGGARLDGANFACTNATAAQLVGGSNRSRDDDDDDDDPPDFEMRHRILAAQIVDGTFVDAPRSRPVRTARAVAWGRRSKSVRAQ